MKITQITPQKRKGRLNLFVDGDFVLGLHDEIFYKSHFHEGDEITESALQQLENEENVLQARDKALRLLGYRARSIAEIRIKLKQKQFNDETVEKVVESLCRSGLLNDTEFADSFARTKIIQRPAGRIFIKQELKAKGISENIIEETLNQIYEEFSEKDLAEKLIQKRKSLTKNIEDPKERKRIIDLLRRRGFNWDIIEQVL